MTILNETTFEPSILMSILGMLGIALVCFLLCVIECLLDEEVSFKEIEQSYKLKEHRGDIYILEEKDKKETKDDSTK